MKVLVTGANGYLGRGVVKTLCDFGATVIATDFSVDGLDERAQKIAGNLFEVRNPYEFFDKPDVVLHMAWRDGFVHNSSAHIEDLPLHYAFLKNFSSCGTKRIAVMGSMHEIGFWEGCIDENTPCNPMSLYGISKNALRRAVELMCKDAGIDFQWLRGYYIVGNSEKGSSIFSKIVKAEKSGQELFPFTTGQNKYDFISYEDFCYQVANVLVQNEINGIINVCSGKPEKLADRVERFIKENGFKIKLQYGVFPDRAYDSKEVWGNSDKINAIIKRAETK